MLKLTKQSDYAIRFLVELDKNKRSSRPLSLRTFAKKYNISFLFLQHLAKQLRDAKLVRSLPGSKGGYFIAKNPRRISLAEVLSATEGERAMVGCIKGSCLVGKKCPVKTGFVKLNYKINNLLNQTMIGDF